MHFRSPCLALGAVTAAFAAGAPAAGAYPVPSGGDGANAVGACGAVSAGPDSGLAGANSQTCLGSGLVFVGPAIGRIATVVGPTVIGPATIGVSAASAGTVYVGPGAGAEGPLP